MLRKIKQNKKLFLSVSERNRYFWGSPQFNLSPDPPLNFFKKINVSLVGGEATEHVGPKILCLGPIGAEISQVRFDEIFFPKTCEMMKNQRRSNDTTFSCRDFVCWHNRGVQTT